MNILEINPYIRHAGQSTILVPYHINRRIILDYELLYVEDGEFLLTYNDKDYYCKKGTLLFLCPNVPHSFHVLTTDLVQPNMHFDLKYDIKSPQLFVCYQDYSELSPTERTLIRENDFTELDTPILKITDKETFLENFYYIIDAEEKHSLTCKSKMLCLLQAIIAENAPEFTRIPSVNSGIAPLIKSYIDSNYEQNISLDILEQQFDYSKFYIEKLFKQEYGVSIIHYRNSKRMEAAIRLLKEHSVSETANRLGFSSIYSFSRAFRMTYGVSPTKYSHNDVDNKEE